MSDPALWKKWKVTKALLNRAMGRFNELSPQASPDIDFQKKSFKEFIDHNELELAMDALEELGEIVPCPGGFWRDLERAALEMELSSRAHYFREKFLVSRPLRS